MEPLPRPLIAAGFLFYAFYQSLQDGSGTSFAGITSMDVATPWYFDCAVCVLVIWTLPRHGILIVRFFCLFIWTFVRTIPQLDLHLKEVIHFSVLYSDVSSP